MNNLKRVLSLGLIGTMLSGMMVMGASAADFTDAEKIQHSEAVNVLVALKVIDGKPDGGFDPEGNVTRAEMAKMIAVAMNGGKEANTGTKTTPSFTDIGGHWAESYIEYCHDLGIISGRGDGTFDPGANVTGLEATKMVLSALGFDAEAYKLTGASWAVRTDEVARTMTGLLETEPNMYEDLTSVMMATPATRDTAAQLIWNGLQNRTRTVQPTTNTSTGSVEWTYITNTTNLLKQRYDADVYTNTYVGNYDTGATTTKGEIRIGSYSFPSDLSIDNIGEEVKVVYKNGKDSVNNGPDRRDTIFGAFNTGRTQVIWATKNDVGNRKTDKAEVNVNGAIYEALNRVGVIYNYDDSTATTASTTNGNADNNSALTGLMKAQSVDKIKLVFDIDNKVSDVYINAIGIAQVTAVTSNRVTLSGVGTITLADNDIYEDIKKDDVVTFTKYYDSDREDAFFTVTKAETVEGKLEAIKMNASNAAKYNQLTVDGTSYKVNNEVTQFPDLGSDTIAKPVRTNIGDTVRLYVVDNMVMGIISLESSGGNYAVITDLNKGETLGSNLNGWTATVMTADGVETTYAIHKDSTWTPAVRNADGTIATAAVALDDPSKDLETGMLVDFSISGGKLKIKEVQETVDVAANTLVWDESRREVSTDNNNATKVWVAASNAVAFAGVDTDTVPDGEVDKYYAYNLRALGDVKPSAATKVAVFLNDDNLVEAMYYTSTKRPGGNTDTTRYGIVSSDAVYVTVSDEDYDRFTVAVGDDESVTINVQGTNAALKKGAIVTFDERSDNCYDITDITVLTGLSTFATTGKAVAVSDWDSSDRRVTYYEGTQWDSANEVWKGSGASKNVVLDKDVKFVYVDQDGDKYGDDLGSPSTTIVDGYANAILYTTSSDANALVDVVVVETSNKANVANDLTGFRTNHKVEFNSDGTKSLTGVTDGGNAKSGTYRVAVSANAAAEGAQITVSVTCTRAPEDGSDAVAVSSSSHSAANNSRTFTSGDTGVTKSWTFVMPGNDILDLAATVTYTATPAAGG